MLPAALVRPKIIEEIQKLQADFSIEGYICGDGLNRFRFIYVQDLLESDRAELEIRYLHEKIDHLLSRQWERLVEIQQIQMELMTELLKRTD